MDRRASAPTVERTNGRARQWTSERGGRGLLRCRGRGLLGGRGWGLGEEVLQGAAHLVGPFAAPAGAGGEHQVRLWAHGAGAFALDDFQGAFGVAADRGAGALVADGVDGLDDAEDALCGAGHDSSGGGRGGGQKKSPPGGPGRAGR